MRKIRILLLCLCIAASFVARADDEDASIVEEQVVANKKVLNHAAQVFAKMQPTDSSVPDAFKELEKEIDGVLPETAKRIQAARKSVYGMRSSLVEMDIAQPGGDYPLSDLYDGRKATKSELAEFDQGVLGKKAEFDAQLAVAQSDASRRALRRVRDQEMEKYKAQRGQIVARARLYQDQINARLKVLGAHAQTVDARADALENRLSVLLDQFESTEHGLNFYRSKLQGIYQGRDASGKRTH